MSEYMPIQFYIIIALLLWILQARTFYGIWRGQIAERNNKINRVVYLCIALFGMQRLRQIIAPIGFMVSVIIVGVLAWYAYAVSNGGVVDINVPFISMLVFLAAFVIAEIAYSRSSKKVDRKKISSSPVVHYFYFPDEDSAKKAGHVLMQEGYTVRNLWQVDIGPLPWSLNIEQDIGPSEYLQREDEFLPKLQSIAKQFGGEYDGHEFALDVA